MVRINSNYQKLEAAYLFPEIKRRVNAFAETNPEAKIISLGIGDVVLPLAAPIIKAMHEAVDEMGHIESFQGYGPYQGYDFLRDAIAKHFQDQGANIQADEVFVSDGCKCDTGNIQEIFDLKSVVAVTDPVYPVYVDSNVMAGRTGEINSSGHFANIVYMPATPDNDFEPELPKEHVDLIYLCSPNNPTGAVMSHQALKRWVDYASTNGSIILFDAVYEAFITDPSLPHSIFEIPGARDVAIEFRTFSKTAGFTGIRCAYTVIPRDLKAKNESGEYTNLHTLWLRRQTTKLNGVSYPVQRAAAAVFTHEGSKAVKEGIAYYMENARIIRDGLSCAGYKLFGGINAPYIWLKTPDNLPSWDFFSILLSKTHIVTTPGAGFGCCGEGYMRLSAFGFRDDILEAIECIKKLKV